MSMMPKMMGSVGKLSPKPPSNFCKLIASGVKKTVSSINLSNEKMANKSMTTAAGNRLK